MRLALYLALQLALHEKGVCVASCVAPADGCIAGVSHTMQATQDGPRTRPGPKRSSGAARYPGQKTGADGFPDLLGRAGPEDVGSDVTLKHEVRIVLPGRGQVVSRPEAD